MTTEKFDIIIIGAGPAGSAAACVLAGKGYRSLLLDRAAFPRDKICGDGVGPRGIHILEKLGIYPQPAFDTFCRMEGVRITTPNRQLLEVPLKDDPEIGSGYVIPRIKLDTLILEESLKRGAVFWDRFTAKDIHQSETLIIVKGQRKGKALNVKAPLAIGAWGAQAGRLNLKYPSSPSAGKYAAIAVRAYYQGLRPIKPYIEIHFDPGLVPGYGWVFPTGPDSANIGFGMRQDCLTKTRRPLRELFYRFIRTNPFVRQYFGNSIVAGPLRGARIPFRKLTQPLVHGRLLQVGDAAGLADPFSGEGISTAMQSGWLAASIAEKFLSNNNFSKKNLHQYAKLCRKEITMNLYLAGIIQSILVHPPIFSTARLLNGFVRKAIVNPGMARAIARLVIGDLNRDVILKGETWIKLWKVWHGGEDR